MKRVHRRWASQEDDLLRSRFPEEGVFYLKNELGRSARAVQARATHLGLKYGGFWAPEEDEVIRECYAQDGTLALSRALGRTRKAIKDRARTLKVKHLNPIRSNGDRLWSEEELQKLRERYPCEGAIKLAEEMGRGVNSVRMAATSRGINIDRGCYKMFSEGRTGRLAKTFKGHGRVYGWYVSMLKNRHWPCDVTAEYLDSIASDRCAISGRPISYKRFSSDSSATASLDRIDSTKGYLVGNVQWVHKVANTMKSTLTESEMRDWCADIVTHLDARKISNVA